jgi:adenine-specific DNA methylase
MNRYLGTKTKILPQIADAISSLGEVDSVCDIFAGSLAVSLFLKRRGHSVIANDINRLSYAYARAYLTPNAIPQFQVRKLLPKLANGQLADLRESAKKCLDWQRETFERENAWSEFHSWNDYVEHLESLSLVLAFLQNGQDSSHPKVPLRSDMLDHYTKVGRKSSFRSVRGTRGRRNYFSSQNARRLDFILSHLRYWVQSGLLDEEGKYALLSIVLDTMERCVNIQGTYHDFPRNELEERARKSLRLFFPNYFGLLRWKRRHVAACEDSLKYIEKAPRHDVLYIDPPYNFRQYTAYYHLPNFFVLYPDIKDLDGYLSKLEFVRGQNMSDDFTSPFSNREQFLPALENLVRSAKCRYVILSYFDGVNHWNKFLAEDNSIGYQMIDRFFKSALFRPGSIKVIPIDRVNYQSQKGYHAKKVTEYLFVAERERKSPPQ